MSGDAGCSLALHMQGGFNKDPSHCLVGGAYGTLVLRLRPWIDLASAFESDCMQRGRQAKPSADLRWLGHPNSERVVWGHKQVTGLKLLQYSRCCRV